MIKRLVHEGRALFKPLNTKNDELMYKNKIFKYTIIDENTIEIHELITKDLYKDLKDNGITISKYFDKKNPNIDDIIDNSDKLKLLLKSYPELKNKNIEFKIDLFSIDNDTKYIVYTYEEMMEEMEFIIRDDIYSFFNTDTIINYLPMDIIRDYIYHDLYNVLYDKYNEDHNELLQIAFKRGIFDAFDDINDISDVDDIDDLIEKIVVDDIYEMDDNEILEYYTGGYISEDSIYELNERYDLVSAYIDDMDDNEAIAFLSYNGSYKIESLNGIDYYIMRVS